MSKTGKSVDLDFRGDSKEVLSSFPDDVKAMFGFNLRRLQNGERLTCKFRPMPSIGAGVFELKDQDERTWYRLLYLTKVLDVIYVLHCFQKGTKRTTRQDLETAQTRLNEVHAAIREKKAQLNKETRHGGD
jgi:phage-related protein